MFSSKFKEEQRLYMRWKHKRYLLSDLKLPLQLKQSAKSMWSDKRIWHKSNPSEGYHYGREKERIDNLSLL